jgi:lipopolysaccharide/colanic/teichoic acid biosynthesis glycosyltransferase|tara:strand:- start:211 stop:852 length:642 start_codon:yes stop_codon:yes gene_type:complete
MGKKYLAIKRAFDFVFATILLVLLSPLMLLIAILIKLKSSGPVIYRQKRVGHNQKTFTFYKFRTMVKDADKILSEIRHLNEVDGPVFKISNDPRLTPFGKFLAHTSLDELPQLWNVLKGEMSFVGFRPPIPSEVKKYEDWQMARFEEKPGITSLWAVQGAHKMSFIDWIKLDLMYNENISFLLDINIVWQTVNHLIQSVITKTLHKIRKPRHH